MTVRSCLLLALIVGVVSAFLGWTGPPNKPTVTVAPSASSERSTAAPAEPRCKAERADLASYKVQLAICRAYGGRIPDSKPKNNPEEPDPAPLDPKPVDPRLPSTEDIETYQQFKDSESGTLLVRHFDGTLGAYNPDEWPVEGDGDIIARKLLDGTIGWYTGPDAGPRSDPAAFQPWEPELPTITWGREPDGTITINGKPASPAVQRMFGGKVEEPAEPQK